MNVEVKAYLDTLTGHPEGDEAAWRARYAPLIENTAELDALPPDKKLAISVVVVAWRATDGVQRALECIGDQVGIEPHQMEVILVDNSGPSGLDALAAEISAHVDVHIRMKGNMGLSPARNTGMSYARAPIVCFLDDDGLIAPDYVQKGLAYFERDANIMAIRSRIKALNHPYFTTLAGHYDRGSEPIDDCLVTEGSMMIRRAAYMEVGGFADQLYGHEGIELTYQLKQRDPGARVLYVPDVVMRHDYIHTWQKFLDKNTRYITLDAATHTRTPELQAFMDEFFATRFPRSPMPTDEYIAWLGLKLLKMLLRYGVMARSSSK